MLSVLNLTAQLFISIIIINIVEILKTNRKFEDSFCNPIIRKPKLFFILTNPY